MSDDRSERSSVLGGGGAGEKSTRLQLLHEINISILLVSYFAYL